MMVLEGDMGPPALGHDRWLLHRACPPPCQPAPHVDRVVMTVELTGDVVRFRRRYAGYASLDDRPSLAGRTDFRCRAIMCPHRAPPTYPAVVSPIARTGWRSNPRQYTHALCAPANALGPLALPHQATIMCTAPDRCEYGTCAAAAARRAARLDRQRKRSRDQRESTRMSMALSSVSVTAVAPFSARTKCSRADCPPR